MADKEITMDELKTSQKTLLYKLAVLSGMKLEVKEGYSGKQLIAINGDAFVGIPLEGIMSQEQFLINIKNICKINGLDFNKYFDAYKEEMLSEGGYKIPDYFQEIENEIVDKLHNLPQKKQYNNVAEVWEQEAYQRDTAKMYFSESSIGGKIKSIEAYKAYALYYEAFLGKGLVTASVPERHRQAFADAEMEIVETLKDVSLEHQKKAIDNLREDPKLEELNDQELK